MSKYQVIEKNVRLVLRMCRSTYADLLTGKEILEGKFRSTREELHELVGNANDAFDHGQVFVVPKQICDSWNESGSDFECRFQDDFRLPYPCTVYLSCDTETGAIDEALIAFEVTFRKLSDAPPEYAGRKVILSHSFANIRINKNNINSDVQDGISFLDINPATALVPACEAMLKSKSSISADAAALPSKLRKKRLNADSAAYTNGFTLVGVPSTISQSEANDDPYPVSAHFRRGHWKRRKTGTYWWDACVVGKGEYKERVGYIGK